MIDIFGYKALRKEIRALRDEQQNLTHVAKVMAKQVGIVLEIHEPGDGSATIAWVRQGDNTVNFEAVRPPN